MSEITTTLTDRYIHAAMRSVPEKSRPDLAAELRASIVDAVEARVENGEPTDAAERAVLTELGDPDALAAGYTERPLYLIGPRYYLEWKRLVKILFVFVLPFVFAAILLGLLLSDHTVGELIGSLWVSTMTVSLHLFFWPTLVFAILERYPTQTSDGTDAGGPLAPWTLDRLPVVRAPGIGLAELVSSLVFVVLTIGALVWDRFVGFLVVDGNVLSILDPDLWTFWIPVAIVVLLGEAVFAWILYRTGRWTPALAVWNTILALAFAIPLTVLLWQGALFNATFFTESMGDSGPEVLEVLTIVLAVTFVGVAVWDVIDGFLKMRRDAATARDAGATARRGV